MQFLLYPERTLRHIISAPFIYSVFFPLVALDIFVEIYHLVSFPLYGISYVERRRYIRIDRHKLSYLKWYEKFNCLYCSYANGLLAYVSKIAAETEKYWCGIKHEKVDGFIPLKHQSEFLEYGDEKAYEKLEGIKN